MQFFIRDTNKLADSLKVENLNIVKHLDIYFITKDNRTNLLCMQIFINIVHLFTLMK